MPGFNFQSLFTEDPERQWVSGPGASGEWRIKQTSLLEDDADPRFPLFQKTWKQGGGVNDLFGPEPFKLQGTVAPSGGDNTRADVAKVQTLLGKAGYLDLGQDGPSGYANPPTDEAIRTFQRDGGLKVDGVLKPGGPTISKLEGLLGGGNTSQSSSGNGIRQGEWDAQEGQGRGQMSPWGTETANRSGHSVSQSSAQHPDLLSILVGDAPMSARWLSASAASATPASLSEGAQNSSQQANTPVSEAGAGQTSGASGFPAPIPPSSQPPRQTQSGNQPQPPGTFPVPIPPAPTPAPANPGGNAQVPAGQNAAPNPAQAPQPAQNAPPPGGGQAAPTIRSPVANPVLRNDGAGGGEFGARRDAGRRQHQGVDIQAAPGAEVVSPVNGRVERIGPAYRDPNAYGGEYRAVHIRGDDGRLYTMRYVEPQGQNGQAIQAGQRIDEGARVGTVQDRARQDRSGRMQNHVHVEIRDRQGRTIDPEPEIRPQRRGR